MLCQLELNVIKQLEHCLMFRILKIEKRRYKVLEYIWFSLISSCNSCKKSCEVTFDVFETPWENNYITDLSLSVLLFAVWLREKHWIFYFCVYIYNQKFRNYKIKMDIWLFLKWRKRIEWWINNHKMSSYEVGNIEWQ